VYIVIIGGGNNGYYLSKALLSEGHEVLVIEKRARQAERIEEELGSIICHGDGCEAATLEGAGTERANLFVALTDEDEDNLVACQVAKHKFNVPRTIARLNNPKNETLFRKLGIDTTISPTNFILEYIEQEVPTHSLRHLLEFKGGELEIVEVKIPSNSGAVGKKMGELSLPPGTILSLVIRKEQSAQVPAEDTIIGAEDRVIAVTSHESEEALCAVLTGNQG
jgi:trk system potassium uptake protein TrkA